MKKRPYEPPMAEAVRLFTTEILTTSSIWEEELPLDPIDIP